ncbi:MAG: hypothetical protein KF846_03855 [Cyclobacteriaceae bacterium]|nr:hypothetical protein [Cyclobacteriaceae bacterium]
MKQRFSDDELLKHMKMVLWDVTVTPEEALSILKGECDVIKGFNRTQLYMKIVNGFNWHTVRKIIPEQHLPDALSDLVIKGLFPRSLREKYRNVRSLL